MNFVFFMFLEARSCLTRLASQIDLLISEGPEGVWNLMVIVNNKVMANGFLLLRLCLSIFANLLCLWNKIMKLNFKMMMTRSNKLCFIQGQKSGKSTE